MTTASLVDIAKGEPDFHTADFIKRAAWEAIEANFTKYTPQPGIPELREAAARKLRTENAAEAASFVQPPTLTPRRKTS